MEHLDLGGDEDKQGHGSCRQVQGGLHLVGRQGAPATPGGGADARLSRVSSEQGAGNGRCGFSNRPQIGVLACFKFFIHWNGFLSEQQYGCNMTPPRMDMKMMKMMMMLMQRHGMMAVLNDANCCSPWQF